MATADSGRIAELLSEAGEAHHRFEQEELGGERDAQWADWYARYALERGLGEVLPGTPDEGELARLLSEATEEHERTGSRDEWSAFTARLLTERLS